MLVVVGTLWIMNAGRPGEIDERMALWREGRYCAVGYSELQEPAAADLAAIRTAFSRVYGEGARTGGARQLNDFAHVVAPGDLVVVRHSARLHLAKVVGEYRYAEPADDDPYRHRREVRWLSTIEKTAALDMATRFRGTLGRVLGDRLETVLAAFSLSQPWLVFEEDSDVAPTDIPPVPTQDDGQARADAYREHNSTVNLLKAEARAQGCMTVKSTTGADLAWMSIDEGWLTVCEVKSVDGSNDIGQLRLGLGQIIDYLDQLRDYEAGVSGLLWTSRKPRDAERWQRICGEHGVTLGWPGQEHLLITLALSDRRTLSMR
jgi:hypothetical protein